MDASQTECLNVAGIKGLNGKSQSAGENVNDLPDPHSAGEAPLQFPLLSIWSFVSWNFSLIVLQADLILHRLGCSAQDFVALLPVFQDANMTEM